MKAIILLAIATWASAAFALDKDYSPFTVKEMSRVAATRTESETGQNVATSFVRSEECDGEFRIAVGGANVLVQPTDNWSQMTKTVIADLNKDGLEDVVKEVYHGTQGLGLGCDLMLFSQYAPGKFSVITVPSDRFTSDDICDLDKDGQKEIITCVLVMCEGHNYWVYRCWHLTGHELVSVDAKYGFPRAVQFKNKPNHQLVAPELLTQIMANYPDITLAGKDSPNPPVQPNAEQTGSTGSN